MMRSSGFAAEAGSRMKLTFAISVLASLYLCDPVAAQSSPAQMISEFRLKHGEGRVTMNETLNRIALEQAKAMAAKDTLDHSVLGSFSSRIAPANAGRAAENIAYGYEGFEKTLGQWIDSTEHRKNLLLHGATRVGVASFKSPTSRRTYWSMEIADEYKPPPPPIIAGPKVSRVVKKKSSDQSCRVKLLGICF
jgi:cysteine-rich secretory family protein